LTAFADHGSRDAAKNSVSRGVGLNVGSD